MAPENDTQVHLNTLTDITSAYCYELERAGCGLFATTRRAHGLAALRELTEAINKLKKSRAAIAQELEAAREALARYRSSEANLDKEPN